MQSEKEKQEQVQSGYYETALLTRKERDWLLGNLKFSRPYGYRLKSSIKRKIQTFVESELPLLIKNNFIISYTGTIITTQALARQRSRDVNSRRNPRFLF